jgi:hypothetical protein
MWKFVNSAVLVVGLWAAVVGAHAQTCALRDNGDGTLTDPVSGLQIRKCAEGQNYSSGKCMGNAPTYKWDAAQQQFGKGTWRLMTKEEADRIVPAGRTCPHGSEYSWTSTTRDMSWSSGDKSPKIWIANFYLGDVNDARPTEALTVRLIRAK